MKLEDQVISLELAKKLKGFGFNQGSLFDWAYPKHPKLLRNKDFRLRYQEEFESYGDTYAAYTVAELGEMLPSRVSGVFEERPFAVYFLDCGKFEYENKGADFNVIYQSPHPDCWPLIDSKGDYYLSKDESEADARAKMLIYLKENELI